eukprot:TRINITY_DN5281_c0_g1_i1.p1 TRINITY_DN5281_c0_g1~~TRINITY_DN5281_c0_g1_i1.p1  ORF type:complete len:405 (+),score=115.52 TRINITY_DN5281_c0_g1_i1:184-1398(+)
MASTVIEETRTFHEDIERLERTAVQFLLEDPKTVKDAVYQKHLVGLCVDRMIDRNKQLVDLYRDEDNLKKEEIAAMGGSGPTAFTTFYDRLRELKEYHRKFSIEPPRPDAIIPTLEDVQVGFTGEEGYGRFLDLHYLFDQWVNLPRRNRDAEIDYLTYLSLFNKFDNTLEGDEYETYLRDLILYLVDWIHRSQPLFNIQELLDQYDQDFNQLWESGTRAWDLPEGTKKESDDKDPLYCEYCKRMFAKSTVFDGHLKGKKHIQAKEKVTNERNQRRKQAFHQEYKVTRLAEVLEDVVSATIDNIVKKQARNFTENAAELEEEEEADVQSDEEEDEEEPVMRIRNYPVGWDGKPIPYWLYKLHGLGVEYKCEICGNTSYWGRRNFERHFQEWRHACLLYTSPSPRD